MRYLAALLIASLLSCSIFLLPWIIRRAIAAPANSEIELSTTAMLCVSVAELAYSLRWIIAIAMYVGCLVIARIAGR